MQPRSSSAGPTRCAIVVLPEPDSPVNQSVKPPPRDTVRLRVLVRVDVLTGVRAGRQPCLARPGLVHQFLSAVDSSRWMPHSSLSEPAQRPARSSSSGRVGRVQGMQPIER